tara:strand:- start:101 stop:388 length:288 start_codon:yes stop_codon:yes gene_type:complete
MYTAPIQPTEYLTLTKEIIMQIQIAEEVKEKYGLYKRIIELNTNYKIIKYVNKMFAEDLEEIDPVIKILKQNEFSFDNDPDGKLKKEVMSVIENY